MTITRFDYETIEVTVERAVATVTLNRPDQLNAWDWQMHRELRTAYADLDDSDEVRVIILTGAGRAFCAGAALAPRGSTFDGSRDPAVWDQRYPGPAREVAELMTPVIAAINGPRSAPESPWPSRATFASLPRTPSSVSCSTGGVSSPTPTCCGTCRA
jgi:enoyl-CoA hydratase/carnithine racemase